MDELADPGEKFFITHLDLIGSNGGFAYCVLDNSDDTFYSSDSFMMFGQGDFELNGGEFDIQSGDHL